MNHSLSWLTLARARWFSHRMDWLVVFAGSTLVMVLGVAFGREYLRAGRDRAGVGGPLIRGFTRWDGNFYRAIAQDGYSYRVGKPSTIHFMPGYPLVGRVVHWLTGLSVPAALVLASHLCFLAALLMLACYAARAYGAEAPGAREAAVLLLGFLPTSVFFHLAYTESLFLLLCVGLLLLIDHGAHPLLAALVVSLAVVTRPVGVALVLPLVLYAWRYGGGREKSIIWVAVCLGVALSGMMVFVGYCGWTFGDPIAFMRNRDDLWRLRPRLPPLQKLGLLLILEPLWGMFMPTSSGYWGRFLTPGQVFFNTHALGPFYFLGAWLLVALGGMLGRLNRYEVTLSLGLLLIPYCLTGYDSALVSMARYVAVIVPLYSYGGFLLSRAPTPLAAIMASVGGFLLGVYAALFTQGHWVI